MVERVGSVDGLRDALRRLSVLKGVAPEFDPQMALTRRQSQPFNDYSELDEALDQAGRELEIAPDQVPTEWMSYAVRPDEIEFWQGDPARRHKRVQYRLVNGVWSRNLLWP